MMKTWAMTLDRGKVRLRAVAFVLSEAVLGKLRIEVNHQAVTGDLGNNAGGGNRETLCVAFDNALRFAA